MTSFKLPYFWYKSSLWPWSWPWPLFTQVYVEVLHTLETAWMKGLLARRRWHRWYHAIVAMNRYPIILKSQILEEEKKIWRSFIKRTEKIAPAINRKPLNLLICIGGIILLWPWLGIKYPLIQTQISKSNCSLLMIKRFFKYGALYKMNRENCSRSESKALTQYKPRHILLLICLYIQLMQLTRLSLMLKM